MLTRLPIPGADNGSWGEILNDFLSQAHEGDGTLKAIPQSKITNLPSTLATKVNTADLATVATTGSYNDLTAKPIIPTIPSQINAGLADYVRDIRDFLQGAETLDRTGATAIDIVFQRAVDALTIEYANQPGGFTKYGYQIFFPVGRYKLTTGITWATGVGIKGATESGVTFLPTGRVCAINGYLPSTTTWPGTTYDDCVFSSFTIDCSQQTHTSYDFTMKGLYIQHMKRPKWLNVTISNAWATGFGADFLEDYVFDNCTAIGCGRGVPSNRYGTGAGFGIGAGSSAIEAGVLTNCRSHNNYSHGYFVERLSRIESTYYSKGLKVVGCSASGNWSGFTDSGTSGSIVSGCTFTGNLFAGYMLRGTGTGLQGGINGTVTNCLISGNGASSGAGVQLIDTTAGGYTFIGNSVSDNTGPGFWAPSTAKIGPDLKILNNEILRNAGDGILTECATIIRPIVRDNTILGNSGDGIDLNSALGRPVIRGNVCNNNTGHGVYLRGSALYSTTPDIQGNNLIANGADGYLSEHTIDVSSYIVNNITDTYSAATNLLADPGYESNTTGTTTLNTTTSRPAGQSPHSGTYVLRGTATASGVGYGVISATGAVAAGHMVRGRVWIRSIPGRIVYGALNLGPGGGQIFGPRVLATGTWQQLEIYGVVPSAKTTCRIAAYVDTDTASLTGDILDIDDVELIRVV